MYTPCKWLLGILFFCTAEQVHAQYIKYSCGRLRSKNIPGKVRSAYVDAVDKNGNTIFKAHNNWNKESWSLSLNCDPVTTDASVAGYLRSSLTLSDTTIKGFINRKNAFVARFRRDGSIKSAYVFKTLRPSYVHRVFSDAFASYASGYARGHRRDQTGVKIPYDKNTAILLAVDNHSNLLWCLNDPDACYGATVIGDDTGEYLYWQGCSRVSKSQSYYTWLKKVNRNTGEVVWSIEDKENFFIFTRSYHSEMSMSLDFRGNIIATQLSAVPFRNLTTNEVYYEKHLEVINYDVKTQQEIFRTTVASADGLANNYNSLNSINIWDSQAFVDGSYHIVGTFKRGKLRIHESDGTTYEERARTGVDSWALKVNHEGKLESANWYAGNGATFINGIGYDGEAISYLGCQYRGLTIGENTFVGYPDKAQIFSAKVADQPKERLILPEEERYQDGEILTDLVVYPNPVETGGSIRFQNKLRAGINYELKIIPIDQITYEATSIASFKLTQQDVMHGSMYVPLGDQFEEGIYYLTLYAEGELESTTRLVIE